MASSSTHSGVVPPIAGRARDLADIEAVIDSVRAGQSRVVLLSGEPGIGKSRLLLHAAGQAGSHGLLVLCGNCYEDAEMAPYGPFVEILRDLVRQRPDLIGTTICRHSLHWLQRLWQVIATVDPPHCPRLSNANDCSMSMDDCWYRPADSSRSCSSSTICTGQTDRARISFGT
jgi:hypothetical protein